jgi:hypothetical protein
LKAQSSKNLLLCILEWDVDKGGLTWPRDEHEAHGIRVPLFIDLNAAL